MRCVVVAVNTSSLTWSRWRRRNCRDSGQAAVRRVRRTRSGGSWDRTPGGSRRLVPGDGPLDPIAILVAQAPSRMKELVPVRYGRTLVSPFTFSAVLSETVNVSMMLRPSRGCEPVYGRQPSPIGPGSGAHTQCCGFSGAPWHVEALPASQPRWRPSAACDPTERFGR